MVEVKSRYDPKNLFRLNQNVPSTPVTRGNDLVRQNSG